MTFILAYQQYHSNNHTGDTQVITQVIQYLIKSSMCCHWHNPETNMSDTCTDFTRI